MTYRDYRQMQKRAGSDWRMGSELPPDATFEDYANQYMNSPAVQEDRLRRHAVTVTAAPLAGMAGGALLAHHLSNGLTPYSDERGVWTAWGAVGGSALGLLAGAMLAARNSAIYRRKDEAKARSYAASRVKQNRTNNKD